MTQSTQHRLLKIYLVCTGVGIIHRGIETFAQECFQGLRNQEGCRITLFRGAGPLGPGERQLWTLPRTSPWAQQIGQWIGRDGYVVEQLSSFLPLVAEIRRERPDLIFYSDANLGFQLYRWRRWIGVPFKLLFSNGGPCDPPFSRTDFVQQVTPLYRDQALAAGEDPAKHFLVPYGIQVPPGSPLGDRPAKMALRQSLGLPLNPPIILSVGWISANHKRMDYVVKEVAALPEPHPHLVLLGHQDEASQPILRLAEQQLGKSGFTIRSVPYSEVASYYQAADIFVLASLKEGFGRVYLEALIHGLPCVVHDAPVMRYVLGEEGTFADLSQPGQLTQTLRTVLCQPQTQEQIGQRRDYVRKRFSWDTLAPAYFQMFQQCLSSQSTYQPE